MKRHPDASVDQQLWRRARELYLSSGFSLAKWSALLPDFKQRWYDFAWTELRESDHE